MIVLKCVQLLCETIHELNMSICSGCVCVVYMHGGCVFAQVENRYDTRSLSEWHKNALESCILDCEQGGLVGSR